MVFDQLVEPFIREMSGHPKSKRREIRAQISRNLNSALGRRELLPVTLEKRGKNTIAIPLRKGSGAITSLANADGYIDIPQETEILDEGEELKVNLFEEQSAI